MEEQARGYASELFLRISEEKRGRIITAAVEEFAAFGYTGANVNRIAQAAEISVGALYKYFAAKEDLFMYIVEYEATIMADFVGGILAEDIRFLSKLEKLLRLAQDYSRRDPNLIRLYSVFTSEHDSGRAEALAQRIEGVTARAYYELIAGAQQRGEVRQDIDAQILAFMLDNQLMAMQYSFACPYYQKRFSLFLGERNAKDNEHVIRCIMKGLQSMFGID